MDGTRTGGEVDIGVFFRELPCGLFCGFLGAHVYDVDRRVGLRCLFESHWVPIWIVVAIVDA